VQCVPASAREQQDLLSTTLVATTSERQFSSASFGCDRSVHVHVKDAQSNGSRMRFASRESSCGSRSVDANTLGQCYTERSYRLPSGRCMRSESLEVSSDARGVSIGFKEELAPLSADANTPRQCHTERSYRLPSGKSVRSGSLAVASVARCVSVGFQEEVTGRTTTSNGDSVRLPPGGGHCSRARSSSTMSSAKPFVFSSDRDVRIGLKEGRLRPLSCDRIISGPPQSKANSWAPPPVCRSTGVADVSSVGCQLRTSSWAPPPVCRSSGVADVSTLDCQLHSACSAFRGTDDVRLKKDAHTMNGSNINRLISRERSASTTAGARTSCPCSTASSSRVSSPRRMFSDVSNVGQEHCRRPLSVDRVISASLRTPASGRTLPTVECAPASGRKFPTVECVPASARTLPVSARTATPRGSPLDFRLASSPPCRPVRRSQVVLHGHAKNSNCEASPQTDLQEGVISKCPSFSAVGDCLWKAAVGGS